MTTPHVHVPTLSVDDVVKDSVGYREKLEGLSEEFDRQTCVRTLSIKRLAGTASANLDKADAALVA